MAPLAPETAPEQALRQIVAGCRDDLLKYRKIVLASRRAVGIHQARVALRRMRAAFSLFRTAASSELSAREMQALAGEAKWLAQECAPSRDLYVFLNETVHDVPAEVTRVANRLARQHLERARVAFSGERFAIFDATLSYRPAFQAALAFDLVNLMLLGVLYVLVQRRPAPVSRA